jgi:hypothetical protein
MIFAVLGSILPLLALAMLPNPDPHQQRLFMLQFALSIATKAALLATGMMVITRSPAAMPLLVVTLLLSVAHSVLMQWWMQGPVVTPTLSAAGRAGRIAGFETGLWLAPVLYLLLIAYLRTPASRVEFGSGPAAPGSMI